MAEEIVITVNGTDYSDAWTKTNIKEVLNQIYSCTLSFNVENSGTTYTDISNGKEVVITFEATEIFRGIIVDIDYTSDDSVSLTAIRRGVYYCQGAQADNYVKTATATSTIVTELIAYITLVTVGTNTNFGNVDYRSQDSNIILSLMRLARVIGYDWWFDYSGGNERFNIDSRKGSATSVITFYTYGETTQNCMVAKRKKDHTGVWNKVKVKGFGDFNRQIESGWANDATSQATWGVREKVWVDRTLKTVSECEELRDRILEDRKDPVNKFTLDFDDVTEILPNDVVVGDEVTIMDNTIFVAEDSGTAESGTINTLTDTDKTWTINEWANYHVKIISGTGSSQDRIISSNTVDTLTVSVNWTTNPDSTSVYQIVDADYKVISRSVDINYLGESTITLECASRTYTFVESLSSLAGQQQAYDNFQLINQLLESTAESGNTASFIDGLNSASTVESGGTTSVINSLNSSSAPGTVDVGQTTLGQDHSSNSQSTTDGGGSSYVTSGASTTGDTNFAGHTNSFSQIASLNISTNRTQEVWCMCQFRNIVADALAWVRLRADTSFYFPDSSGHKITVFNSTTGYTTVYLKLPFDCYNTTIYLDFRWDAAITRDVKGQYQIYAIAEHNHTVPATGAGGLIVAAGVLLEKTSLVTTSTTAVTSGNTTPTYNSLNTANRVTSGNTNPAVNSLVVDDRVKTVSD